MLTYTSEQLRSFNKCKQRLHPSVWKTCKDLGLVKATKRGIRSGKCFKLQRNVSGLKFESEKNIKDSPTSELSFGYVNTRSIKNKSYVICDLVLEKKFDVFLKSETSLSETGD